MPIRFRCAYCNQLLGIARRKAGTVVRCPGCSGQVVVPTLEEAGIDDKDKDEDRDKNEKSPPRPSGQHGAFEGNEIDKMLEGTAGEQPSVIQPGPGPVLTSQAAGKPPASTSPAPATAGIAGTQPGIVLSPSRATMLSVAVVIALAVAFGVGLLVGLILGKR